MNKTAHRLPVDDSGVQDAEISLSGTILKIKFSYWNSGKLLEGVVEFSNVLSFVWINENGASSIDDDFDNIIITDSPDTLSGVLDNFEQSLIVSDVKNYRVFFSNFGSVEIIASNLSVNYGK